VKYSKSQLDGGEYGLAIVYNSGDGAACAREVCRIRDRLVDSYNSYAVLTPPGAELS